MINLILFGPPGSGKGTQAQRLAEKYNLIHLSTGELFRSNMKNETKLGQLAQDYINKGELVPDEVTTAMVKNFLETHLDAIGFIFDGYPRTTTQAQDLDELVEEVLSSPIALTLALEVDEKELTERLLDRGKSSGRKDDSTIDIIKNRIVEYNTKTAPVAQFYKEQEKYESVNGVGSIDEITENLSKTLENYF